jgi:cyclohexadieny/prephenate dehydrogenase
MKQPTSKATKAGSPRKQAAHKKAAGGEAAAVEPTFGSPMFDKVALIGLGLMGSSLGHAMKRRHLAGHINGNARSKETLEAALRIGFIDSAHADPCAAVENADLIVICVPVGLTGAICEKIAPALKTGAILTDVGSVKTAVIRDCLPFVPDGVHFVPGHPMAGTEYSGPESGFASLFDNRWTMLTPLPGGDEAATAKLKAFWEACGANVDIMSAKHHDLVAAITSHLPHLIAYNIVGTVDDLEGVTEQEIIKYAAGGFRDFTRIAASDPTMWRDIFLNNKEAVLEVLGRFNEDLSLLARAIRWGDGDTLFKLFERTRAIRKGILEMKQDR